MTPLSFQVVLGAFVLALGTGLSQHAVDTIYNSAATKTGIVLLLICSLGIVVGGFTMLGALLLLAVG